MKFTPLQTNATAKGLRPYQEDRAFVSIMPEGTLFAVFDGHGGDEVSKLACDELLEFSRMKLVKKGLILVPLYTSLLRN